MRVGGGPRELWRGEDVQLGVALHIFGAVLLINARGPPQHSKDHLGSNRFKAAEDVQRAWGGAPGIVGAWSWPPYLILRLTRRL